MQASARQAEEQSRTILEEEEARDAAWRQAVLKVASPVLLLDTLQGKH